MPSRSLTDIGKDILKSCKSFCVSSAGVVMAMLCAIHFSMEDQLIYVVENDFHPTMVFVYDSNVSCVLCVIAILVVNPKIPTSRKELFLIIAYGSLSTTVHMTLALSIIFIGPGSATALSLTSTVFAVILSAIFLRIKPKASDIAFIICSITGVFIITRYVTLVETTNEKERNVSLGIIGVALALTSAITYASALTVGKKLSQLETPTLIAVFSYLFQYSVTSLILCMLFDAWKLPETFISTTLVLGTGFLLFVAMLFEYLSVKFTNPTTVSIILTSEIVMDFVGQFVLFSFPFNWTVVLGSFLVIFSCIGILVIQKEGQGDEVNGEDDDEDEPIIDNYEILY